MRPAVLFAVLAVAASAAPLQFHGSVGVTAEQSWLSTDSGPSSVHDLRLTFNPTLSVFGFPVNLDVLLSSQESNIRQALNKFRLYLNPENLLAFGLARSGFNIPGCEVGTCNPSWSELTLSGVSVTGAAVELQPWNFYIAGAGGRAQRAVEGSDTTQPAYRRMLYAGKLGYGRKDGTHFYLTYLHAGDDSGSLRRNWAVSRPDTALPPETTEVTKPQENNLVGAELNLTLVRDHWRITSEIAGSELTRDSRLPVITADWLPDWAERTFKPRLSTQVDFAYRARSEWNVLETKAYAGIRMLGPGYKSLGTSFERNDNLGWEAGIERGFADNQLFLSGAYATDHDNLIGMKLTTSRFQSYSVNIAENFAGIPYLQVAYNRTSLVGPSTNRSDMVSAGTGHNFTTGKLTHSPNLSVSWQAQQSTDSGGDYTSIDVSLNHSITFESPLSLSVGLGWGRTDMSGEREQLLRVEATPAYTFFRIWNNSVGLSGTFESDGRRIDIAWNSSVPLWKIADARFAVTRGIYSGTDPTAAARFSEWRLSGGLSKSW